MKKVFIALILISLHSCGKEKNRTDLTRAEQILFDSLYTIRFKNMRTETDSLCNLNKDSLFTAYVDSLLDKRRIEIEQLFNEK